MAQEAVDVLKGDSIVKVDSLIVRARCHKCLRFVEGNFVDGLVMVLDLGGEHLLLFVDLLDHYAGLEVVGLSFGADGHL